MKSLLSNAAVMITAGLLLTACTTYRDIREKHPAQVRTVRGEPSRLADCLIDKLQLNNREAWTGYGSSQTTWHKSLDNRTVHLSESNINGFAWDLALTPTSSGTQAELRSLTSLWGTPQAPSQLWSMIAVCGG
jgi:hypothetical protein